MKKLVSLFLAIVMISTVLLISCGGAEAGQYNDAKALYEAGKYEEAQTAFEAIKDYEDSKDWVKKCKTAILDGKYDDAIAKLDAGNIIEAYEALIALDGHKDSADKAAGIADQYKAAKLKNAKAGDIVTFGRYEQDNDLDNGVEDIEWIVLEVKDGKALLVSKYVLDFKTISEKSPYTWISGGIRKWCNNDFYDSAFNTSEQAKIQTTTLSADPTTKSNVYKDADTKDKIFALNISETEKYFPSQAARKCEWTAYAKAESPFPDGEDLYCEWWLRNVVADAKNAYIVNSNGGIVYTYGRVEKGMRPAMWIDLGV